MLLIKNDQGINDVPVEKHGVICNRPLPVAGDIPLKHLVAELRPWRPGTQAARQALLGNGACGLSGTIYPRSASASSIVVLPAPGSPVMTKRRLVISSTQVRSPNETEISHGRVPWQTRSWLFGWGPSASWLC